MKDERDITETERIVNRHMARILTNLGDANCPDVYIQAVKSEMAWLRKDLNELNEQQEKNDEGQDR